MLLRLLSLKGTEQLICISDRMKGTRNCDKKHPVAHGTEDKMWLSFQHATVSKQEMQWLNEKHIKLLKWPEPVSKPPLYQKPVEGVESPCCQATALKYNCS